MTVEEAKARGIDIENAEQIDAATDATSPVGQAPPKDAVADLAEKTRELRVDDGATAAAGKPQLAAVPLPGGEAPKSQYQPFRNGLCLKYTDDCSDDGTGIQLAQADG